jgi:hypothetical protein
VAAAGAALGCGAAGDSICASCEMSAFARASCAARGAANHSTNPPTATTTNVVITADNAAIFTRPIDHASYEKM